MKKLLTLITAITLITSCEKNPPVLSASNNEPAPTVATEESLAPYSKTSRWKCIEGDTSFTENLTLELYYIEKAQACNLYYYELSYPVWSEYEYSHCVSGCIGQTDTLIIKDFNSNKKVKFLRIK